MNDTGNAALTHTIRQQMALQQALLRGYLANLMGEIDIIFVRSMHGPRPKCSREDKDLSNGQRKLLASSFCMDIHPKQNLNSELPARLLDMS